MLRLQERLAGGLVGMLVGDALGVPYEFRAARDIPVRSEIEFEPPVGFRRAHKAVPPGTWSDDGAQALCLLSSLLETGSLDPGDFAGKLRSWICDAEFTPDGRVFDRGIQTRNAFDRLFRGVPPDRSGPAGEMDNGNGSLMRVLPLALWHRGPDEQLYADARSQSLCTHGHLRSQLCCAFYCLWARELLSGADDGWLAAGEKMRGCAQEDELALKEIEFILREAHRSTVRGSGYVLDALWTARVALQESSYEQVVRAAIAFGNDTDTTACIAGGLAGVRGGIDAIPERWKEGLRGRDVYEPLLTGLLRYHQAKG